MNAKTLECWDRRVSIQGNLVSVSFNCDFGPINFSFNLEMLSEKLLKTVSELLDRLHQEDPDILNTIVKDTGLTIEEVKRNLKSQIMGPRETPKLTALEKFMEGRNVNLEGSLQQILEALPASITLMLMHLTTAAVMLNLTEDKKDPEPLLSLMQRELSDHLFVQLKSAVYRLLS